MVEDSREPSSSQEPGSHLPASIPNTDPKKPKHDFPQSQVGKLWDAFGNPEEPVNALANASYKPRGKDPKDVSYSDVVGTVSMSEISSFYKAPCARESLLTGIGAGFGIGGVRAVFGGMRSLWSAGNWAVGVFAVTSLGAYEFCRRRRIQELHGMKEAVELMKELKEKKQRDKERAAAEAARRAEEERQKKSWTNLSNYKFW
ncbi:uncharacterized protein N7496_001193 [Penicillium cataractarum]|uniref:Cytochrome c oxidase assembly protein COX20, mitochondrial n=1 Tax=Penicillium cataractarum TaxID=2100454 RepID=A0A9X0B6P3_9EURO|nr:uncharacterized protein N7496_001193 [Penicillium cataractarum]KAJ5390125.1 hypothetical protein N7496_001193 [Penicillium cataractarum]